MRLWIRCKPVGSKANRLPKRDAGFSLIELTCALFIVTLGVFGIIQMYLVGMDKTRAVNEYAVAFQALNNEIETLRALPFEAFEEGKDLPFRSETPALERLVHARGTVTVVDRTAETPGLKQVRARLRWTGEHGRIIEKHVTTLIARKR